MGAVKEIELCWPRIIVCKEVTTEGTSTLDGNLRLLRVRVDISPSAFLSDLSSLTDRDVWHVIIYIAMITPFAMSCLQEGTK